METDPTNPTTPASTQTPTSTEQPTDPRRKGTDPSFTPVDPRISQLRPFLWPASLEQSFADESLASVQTAARLVGQSYDTIITESTKAFERVVSQFNESVGKATLESLPDSARDKLISDTTHKANEAAKAEQAKQEGIYKNVQALHEETLSRISDQIEGILAVAPSPAALLDINSPMSERRIGFMNMLAQASYPSLTTWVSRALTTGDKDLHAAVVNELSKRREGGARNVPMSPFDFAERIAGEQHKRLVLLRDEIRHLRNNLQSQRVQLVRGRASLVSKIEAGLRQQALNRTRKAVGAA